MAYSVTKAAQQHLMKALASTQGPKARVNAVLPGLLLTEWVRTVHPPLLGHDLNMRSLKQNRKRGRKKRKIEKKSGRRGREPKGETSRGGNGRILRNRQLTSIINQPNRASATAPNASPN